MNYIKFVLVLTLLLNFARTPFAQNKLNLTIGDIVPNLTIPNIVNFASPTANISSFRGKLLILDFWATWCGPCIEALPTLDSLQHKYSDRLQILPVTEENREIVSSFLQKFGKIKHVYPASVIEDNLLSKYFPHTYLPHSVWIDPEGKVIAITEGKEVTEDHITQYFRNTMVDLPLKSDTKDDITSGPDKQMFSSGIYITQANDTQYKQLPKESELIHSTLTGFVDGLVMGGTEGDSVLVKCMNLPIAWLYRVALWNNDINILNASKTVTEVRDSNLYKKITSISRDGTQISGIEYQTWLRKNGYSYEIKVPAELAHQKCEIMLEELNRYFGVHCGIKGKLEKRKVHVLALRRISTDDKMQSNGGNPIFKNSKISVTLKNFSISALLACLSTPLQLQPPIIDETNYPGKIDIELNCDLSNLTEVNKELDRYGLKFVQTDSEQIIGVITDIESKS